MKAVVCGAVAAVSFGAPANAGTPQSTCHLGNNIKHTSRSSSIMSIFVETTLTCRPTWSRLWAINAPLGELVWVR